jgi:hypothetical protein
MTTGGASSGVHASSGGASVSFGRAAMSALHDVSAQRHDNLRVLQRRAASTGGRDQMKSSYQRGYKPQQREEFSLQIVSKINNERNLVSK